MKPFLSRLLTSFAFFSTCAGTVACQSPQQTVKSETLEVSVVEVEEQEVMLFTDFVGSINGIENAEIRARVAGYLEAVHFKEGSRVKQGDLLFTIDPVLSQAEVRKAQGDVAMARASASKAQADVDRLTPLVATNAVSRQELDHATAAKQSADAQILAAQGDLATAQASLDYTKVKSPINGIAGIRQVSIGSLVGQSEPTLLTTVSQLDTVRVRFPISEQRYLEHARLLNTLVTANSPDADFSKRPRRLQLILADGSIYPEKGWIALIDREVSISTGSIMLEARFPNPNGLLRPGQFGRVRAPTGHIEKAIGIPQRAVIERQSMHEVLVLDQNNKVTRRSVTVGDRVGSAWLILKGLKVHDKVLIEGLQKVKPGMTIKPVMVPMKPISPPLEGLSFSDSKKNHEAEGGNEPSDDNSAAPSSVDAKVAPKTTARATPPKTESESK